MKIYNFQQTITINRVLPIKLEATTLAWKKKTFQCYYYSDFIERIRLRLIEFRTHKKMDGRPYK